MSDNLNQNDIGIFGRTILCPCGETLLEVLINQNEQVLDLGSEIKLVYKPKSNLTIKGNVIFKCPKCGLESPVFEQ